MLSRTINLKRADYVVYFTCKFDPYQHFSCQVLMFYLLIDALPQFLSKLTFYLFEISFT